MKKGKFIVIEGADGLGKSTLINNLKNDEEFNNMPVIYLNDPSSDIPIAKDIRAIRKSSTDKMCKETDLLLTLAARRELTKEIKKCLEFANVVCDRYSLSTYMYQGMNFNDGLIFCLHQDLHLEIKPDITLVLTRNKPYKEETDDAIEKVFRFDDIEKRYEDACKGFMRNRYNIVEICLGDKTSGEVLNEAKNIIKNIEKYTN